MVVELPNILIRRARREDLPALVAMFAADALGGHGDTTDPEAFQDYVRAFAVIEASPTRRFMSQSAVARSSARSRRW